MVYTKRGPFVDASPTGPYVDAAFFNNVEAALTGVANASVAAPAPSGDTTGATDTAALQALITSIQATGMGNGTLVLQAGTYYITNLVTTTQATQPRIVGQGKMATKLRGVGTGPILRFRGVSGTVSGGWFGFLQFYGTGASVGVEIAGACGVKWQQVIFDGPMTEGIRFRNENAGDYTEFCSGEAEFTSQLIGPAVHYQRENGDKSFHNSGLIEGSLINQNAAATWPLIQVDAGCLPYDAPLTVHIFARASQPLIKNLNTTDYVNFRGQLTMEQFIDNCTIFDPAGTTIWYTGTLNAYGHVGLTVGNVKFVDRIWTPAASGYPVFQRRPFSTNTTLAAGTTTLATLDQRSSYLVSVRISDSAGTVYYYDQLLYVVLNSHVGTGTGYIATVATPRNLDTGTIGAPTYALTGNLLQVTNASYGATLTAQVTITTVNGWVPLP